MQVPLNVMQPPHEVWDQTPFSHADEHWASTAVSYLLACSVCVVVSYSLFLVALRRIAREQRTGDPGQDQQLISWQPLLTHSADDVEAVSLIGQDTAVPVTIIQAVASTPPTQASIPDLGSKADHTDDAPKTKPWASASNNTSEAVIVYVLGSPMIQKPLTLTSGGDVTLPRDVALITA